MRSITIALFMTVVMFSTVRAVRGQAASAVTTDTFRVGAEQAGVAYNHIGKGRISYQPSGGKSFRVSVDARITNPQTEEQYEIRLALAFVLDEQRLYLKKEQSKSFFSEAARQYAGRVEALCAFAHIVRITIPPQEGREPTRTYVFRGDEYTLLYVPTERYKEVTLIESGQKVAKFFLCRDSVSLPVQIAHFRLYPGEGRALRFAVTGPDGKDRGCSP